MLWTVIQVYIPKRWYHQQRLLIETITRYRENSVWSNWIQNGFVQKWWAPLMATIWALLINIDKLINLGCIRPSSMGFPQPFLHNPSFRPQPVTWSGQNQFIINSSFLHIFACYMPVINIFVLVRGPHILKDITSTSGRKSIIHNN